MSNISGVEHSPGYNSQTHADPVIRAVIRKIENQVLTITSEDGTRIWVRGEDLKPLLTQWTFTASRKGLVWARLKKNAPSMGGNPTGQTTEPTTTKEPSHAHCKGSTIDPGQCYD